MHRRHDKPFPYVVAWTVATLAAFAGTGRLGIAQHAPSAPAAGIHAAVGDQPQRPAPPPDHDGGR